MISNLVLTAFRDQLEVLKPGWTIDGDSIVGPAGAHIFFSQEGHSDSSAHFDIRFQFASPMLEFHPGVWDCVTGLGDTDAEIAQTAAQIWVSTTGGACLELQYSRQGEFAGHFSATDKDGFHGWHSITGNVMAWGVGGNGPRLQNWWLAHPFFPQLAEVMNPNLRDDEAPHGFKMFICPPDIAEVRLNGEVHEAASQVMLDLAWPELTDFAVARSYCILIHRDP